MKIRTMAAATGVLSLALAAPAAAHITVSPGTAPSEGYTTQTFQVPHGCEESPTTQVRIRIPRSVSSATPAVHPLWKVTTKEGPKDPVELHGEKITRGVSEIAYTARQPLAPDRLDLLPVSLKMPAGKEGEPVYFPVIQRCQEGETAWIQTPAEGESEDDLESPAPAIELTAAEGDHDAAEPAAEKQSAELQTAGAAGDDDSAPTWLTIVALGIGALGLMAGLAGLSAARRRPSQS